jgi:protein-S-isoprenylcysteine O-methyltransferase Ste14
MEPKKVIKRSNLPPKLPITGALVVYLCLDRWQAPGWLYGAFGAIFAVYFIVVLAMIWNEEEHDLLKNK